MADRTLSTGDLAWLVLAHERYSGYVPFKDETIKCLRELYELQKAEDEGVTVGATAAPDSATDTP